MASSIIPFLNAKAVADAISVLGENFEGLHIDFGKAEDDVFFVDPPFQHLAEYAEKYGNDYGKFVDDIELDKEQLVFVPPFEEDDKSNVAGEIWQRPVHLMTALRAKGKEFDTVIMLDCNEGIWPNKNAVTSEELEAERRVFYVGFTRARQKVLMLVSKSIRGKAVEPSRYLTEMGLLT